MNGIGAILCWIKQGPTIRRNGLYVYSTVNNSITDTTIVFGISHKGDFDLAKQMKPCILPFSP